MLEPDHRCLAAAWVLYGHEVQLVLSLSRHALSNSLHIRRSIHINELDSGRERAKRQTFVELAFKKLNLDELHHPIAIHVSHLIVAIHAEVGASDDVADLEEVEALQANWNDTLLIASTESEFIEALSLLINLDPSVESYIAENLILSL